IRTIVVMIAASLTNTDTDGRGTRGMRTRGLCTRGRVGADTGGSADSGRSGLVLADVSAGVRRSCTRSLSRTASDEAVTRAAHRADVRRPLRIVSQLLTQTADQNVDRTIIRLPVDAAGFVHDALTAQHAAAIAHEQPQQLELCGRQRQDASL